MKALGSSGLLLTTTPGGHLRPDLFLDVVTRAREHGVQVTNEIALFEVANAKAVTELIEEEGIECELHQCVTAYTFLDKQEAELLKKAYDDLRDLCPTLKEVTYYGPVDAERVTSVKGAKATFSFPAATVW